MGPTVFGTALNPINDHPRYPLREEDVDDDLDINGNNSTIPMELTVYEPDEEFAKDSSTSSQESQQRGGEN